MGMLQTSGIYIENSFTPIVLLHLPEALRKVFSTQVMIINELRSKELEAA